MDDAIDDRQPSWAPGIDTHPPSPLTPDPRLHGASEWRVAPTNDAQSGAPPPSGVRKVGDLIVGGQVSGCQRHERSSDRRRIGGSNGKRRQRQQQQQQQATRVSGALSLYLCSTRFFFVFTFTFFSSKPKSTKCSQKWSISVLRRLPTSIDGDQRSADAPDAVSDGATHRRLDPTNG